MKIKLILLAAIGALFACNENNDLSGSYSDPDYPTKYCIKSVEERNELYENLDSNLKYFFEVDSFGFLNWANEVRRTSDLFEGKLNDSNFVLDIARNFINKNEKLYGVQNSLELKVDKIDSEWAGYGSTFVQESELDRNRWFIRFKNQMYNNIEVYNTQVGMYISPKGVYRSFGHWYPNIYLPGKEVVSFDEAKIKLVGVSIDYYDWTGSKEHTITLADFYGDDLPKKMIVPYRKGDCIEMRLCWFIASKTIWNFYVDVVTGELVQNEQTVYF